jgi:hypothetical protein
VRRREAKEKERKETMTKKERKRGVHVKKVGQKTNNK